MKKRWKLLKPDNNAVQKICRELKCHPVTAAVLVNREIQTTRDAVAFIKPSLHQVRSPFAIKDMDRAVSRIAEAITGHEKILVFGDYDVDGITATTLLYEFLSGLGAEVTYYIPHRTDEGYSLQPSHVTDAALPAGINLIVTVDCGSDSHMAVDTARKAGIDVVITDHHNIFEPLPAAHAVVNPKRRDCPSGFEHLAGVGVVFTLLICLRKYLRDLKFYEDRSEPNLKDLCDLVALGTVADVVPLVEENRILTKTGIDVINSGNRPGLRALVEVSGIKDQPLAAEDIAFRLAPRLNAAGRMDHAKTAVELLTTRSLRTADQIARQLNAMNSQRQETEKIILDHILQHLAQNPEMLEKKTLVLSHGDWHAGLLGIVASRMVERFFRPVVLIATKDGIGKGSARSIPGLDLYHGLAACREDLDRFGGHSMAAGLQIKAAKIDNFRKNFEQAVGQVTQPADFMPEISIDYELNFDRISDQLIDELESLMPFGPDNPEPLFMAADVAVKSATLFGKNHRRMRLAQGFGKNQHTMSAIHFNADAASIDSQHFDQVAFRLRWNRWNGKKVSQIIIEET